VPLYEYECEACGKRFEKIQKYSDPLVDVCPNCGKGPVKKLLSSPAIQFKGSGFYITDYAKKGSPESSTSASQSKPTSDKSSSDSSSSSSSSSSESSSKSDSKTAADKKS
jgi:putative FmdB family regulatory protein